MSHQTQILVVRQRVIGYHLGVPVRSLRRRPGAAEREIEHRARESGLAQRDCAANDESCDCRPVRFRDITITPAPPGMDPRHATTPLLGEATNPIDATIADAGGGGGGAGRGEDRGYLAAAH
jgi:hypothetical protein